jgi:hypothetical protein
MKTVTNAFATGQSATTVFRSLLPSDWLVREQHPDFHVDFLVETVQGGELTGKQFGVQLKGFNGYSGAAHPLKYSLKCKHLRYYSSKVLHPVFLVLVDVKAKTAYWCFTQNFAREKLTPFKLRGNGKVRVPFSEANSFENLEKFIRSLDEAISYMRNLHPGSIPAAVAAEKARLTGIDPRLNVDIQFRDGQSQLNFTAKEPFPFTLKVTDPSLTEQDWTDSYQKGSSVNINTSLVQVEGSPLLSHMIESGGAKQMIVSFGRDFDASADVFEVNPVETFLFHLDGKFRCGAKYGTFEGSIPHSPLTLKTTVSPEGLLKAELHDLAMIWSFREWKNHPLMQLPFFDSLYRFSQIMKNSGPLLIRFIVRGNRFFDAKLHSTKRTKSSKLLHILECLYKARYVAQKYGINPVFTELTSVQIDHIEIVYQLLQSSEAVTPVPNFRLKIETSGSLVPALSKERGWFRIEQPAGVFKLLGQDIALGHVTQFFNDVLIQSISRLPDGRNAIRMVGSKASKRVIRLLNTANMADHPSATGQM